MRMSSRKILQTLRRLEKELHRDELRRDRSRPGDEKGDWAIGRMD